MPSHGRPWLDAVILPKPKKAVSMMQTCKYILSKFINKVYEEMRNWITNGIPSIQPALMGTFCRWNILIEILRLNIQH